MTGYGGATKGGWRSHRRTLQNAVVIRFTSSTVFSHPSEMRTVLFASIDLVLQFHHVGLGLGHAPVDLVHQLVQALVERIATKHKLLQNFGCPLPELYAALRINAIAKRDNDIEIEILHVTDDPANTFLPNCSNYLA